MVTAAETKDRSLHNFLLDVIEDLLPAIISIPELFDTATLLVRLQMLKGIQVCAGDVEPVSQRELKLQKRYSKLL